MTLRAECAILDIVMLREGLKLARKLGNTAPLSSAVLSEISPGSSVQSDDDWDAFAAKSFGTEFHPSCSCAMLPLDQGGVVDANLKVYGLGKPSKSFFSYHVLTLVC
jgi:choline dehydrogenase